MLCLFGRARGTLIRTLKNSLLRYVRVACGRLPCGGRFTFRVHGVGVSWSPGNPIARICRSPGKDRRRRNGMCRLAGQYLVLIGAGAHAVYSSVLRRGQARQQ